MPCAGPLPFRRHTRPRTESRVVTHKEWQRLVQVCQRWRQIIYASPRYLELHLCCTNGTPFKEELSRWPAFPIIIAYHLPNSDYRLPDDDDDYDVELIAALEHPDRVQRVDLDITISGVEEVFAVMQVPFLVLTHLGLTGYVDVPVLSGGFLGGSAPCLQHLRIEGVPFPELPTLLLSARDLVFLQLGCGYISPEAMVVGLAGLTRLRTLCIKTHSPTPPPEPTRRPSMLAVLPALTRFVFGGDSEYLEDLVAQIDTPRIDSVSIEYSMEEVRIRQLSQFIDRTANLKLAQFTHAQVSFSNVTAYIELDCPQGERHQVRLSITVLGRGLDFQVPYVVHVLGQLDTTLSNVGHLSVCRAQIEPGPVDEMDTTGWLPLFRLFPAVETMHVSRATGGYIAPALEDIAEEMVTEVLPALYLLFLEDDDEDDKNDHDHDGYDSGYDNIKPVGSVERFLSLHQLSGLPVTTVKTEDEFVESLMAHRTVDSLLDEYESSDLDSG